jgi:DNA/RNA-binding domain of Phe-tRNA-synthetase-like protein
MHFCHAREIWADYPELVPGVVFVQGITGSVSVAERIKKFNAIAESRLAARTEGEFPEVQAWRRVFSRMGLKPTQYRCASESLLRRFRNEKSLPPIHPVIDLCNSISMAFATPVAVFDVSKADGYLEVRYAAGSEVYLTFSGQIETPAPREVVFADGSGRAHARRWTNRQSGYSAVQNETTSVLIVAEAMHQSGHLDVPKLTATVVEEIRTVWSVVPKSEILTKFSPRFEFQGEKP